jgi:integrase
MKDAKAWEVEMKKLSEEEWNGTMNTVCLYDWAKGYLDHAKANCVSKTYKEKKAVFKSLFKHIDPSLPVDKLTPGQILKYLETQKLERTGNAANKDRKNLIAAWNWGTVYFEPKLPPVNPCIVKKMSGKKRPRYVPPEEDYMAVYKTAKGQDKIIVLFTYATAMRRGEIFRTKIDDLDLDSSRVRVWTRKREDGSWEYDWIPIPPELNKAIKWWLNNRPIKDHPFLFYCLEDKAHIGIKFGEPYIERNKFMINLCKKAGVKPFGFHGLRHLRATTLYHQGKSIAAIQSLLRHKNPNTTVKYLKSLGLNVLNEELKDLSLQSGSAVTFEPEDMEPLHKNKNKKPSEEPSTLQAALSLTDHKAVTPCNH